MQRYFFAIIAALGYGMSPVLARFGSQHGLPPIAGATWAVICASPLLYLLLRWQGKRIRFSEWSWRARAAVFGSSLTTNLGVIFYWKALAIERVSVVVALNSIYPLLTVVLAYFFLRADEQLNLRLLVAAVLIVGGAVLVAT